MEKPSVLVIEDEQRYRDLLELNLRRQQFRCLLASDGLTGLNLLERESPDLVILDLMLPDIDGYELCQRIRDFSDVPIIILTARAEEAQKVRGLRLGADDYVTKPFGAEELLARIRAQLRRRRLGRQGAKPNVLVTDGLVVDFDERRVTVRGREVQLTPNEYKVLYWLALNAGRVLVHDELLRRVWGLGYEDEVGVLHTTIGRLRRKIEEDPAKPRYILTKRNVGYWLATRERS